MSKLVYKEEIRYESDIDIIQTLLRKGWQIVEEPITYEYDNDPIMLAREEARKIVLDKIALGYSVLPENFVLGYEEQDRSAFTQMTVLIREALNKNLIDNNTPQTIKDINRTMHTVITDRYLDIIIGYGLYYKQLWDQLP